MENGLAEREEAKRGPYAMPKKKHIAALEFMQYLRTNRGHIRQASRKEPVDLENGSSHISKV